jgi:hypothetical protein
MNIAGLGSKFIAFFDSSSVLYCEREMQNFVALRNMCNTLQQRATKLIISTLSADKILSLTRSCQHFLPH